MASSLSGLDFRFHSSANKPCTQNHHHRWLALCLDLTSGSIAVPTMPAHIAIIIKMLNSTFGLDFSLHSCQPTTLHTHTRIHHHKDVQIFVWTKLCPSLSLSLPLSLSLSLSHTHTHTHTHTRMRSRAHTVIIIRHTVTV